MRIVVMGTGPFAVPTCDQIVQDGHEVPLCVTRPLANPKAKKLPPRPVYDWAKDREIPIFEPESINLAESIQTLHSHAADLFFVCDYGQILSKECLAAAKLGGINLHGSLLPRHRGAAPVQWTLLRGDRQAGVTVIHMTPGLDAGPALSTQETAINPDENAGQLEERLSQLGVHASRRAIDLLQNWDGESILGDLQDKSLVTRAPRFSKAHGALDFRLPAEYLVRLVRALQPWPGTFGELVWQSGKRVRVIVRSARVCDLPSNLDSAEPGTAIQVDMHQLGTEWSAPWNDVIAVKTGDKALVIGKIQPSGKREMTSAEFTRGHAIPDGTRFELPSVLVEMLTV